MKATRTSEGLGILCLVVLYFVLPLSSFPASLLGINVAGTLSYLTVEIRNYGPWPITIHVRAWGTSLYVPWTVQPTRDFVLMPFGRHVENYAVTGIGDWVFFAGICFSFSVDATFMNVYPTYALELQGCGTPSRS